MKLRPESTHYRRDSPWILITLPNTPRRQDDDEDDADDDDDGGVYEHALPLNNKGTRKNRMSFGIHQLVAKNNALNAGPASWPRPKMKLTCSPRPDDDDDDGRPRTATLEFPKVLDVALLGKVDMTRLSKQSLLQIANLCILPVAGTCANKAEAKRARGGRTRRLAPSPARKLIRFVSSDQEAVRGAVTSPRGAARGPGLKATTPNVSRDKSTDSDREATRAKRTPSRARRRAVDDVFGGVVSVAAPCTTCGRPDQPERLHSHPPPAPAPKATPVVATPREPVKSSVRKPIAMRYRTRRRDEGTTQDAVKTPEVRRTPARRTPEVRTPEVRTLEVRTPELRALGVRTPEVRTPEVSSKRRQEALVVRSPDVARPEAPASSPDMNRATRGSRGPRTLMCYICGRGFGTASFPLHEPQCLQRWNRENASLPPHLQRPAPRRPGSPLCSEEWNRQAFEASQAQLVSCANCARTFNPDRLEVHQRSCRPGVKRVSYTTTTSPNESTSEAECEGAGPGEGAGPRSLLAPPTVHCYICGRMFGSKSIGIHEPQCLERWRAEDARLPPSRRRPEPVKPAAATKRLPPTCSALASSSALTTAPTTASPTGPEAKRGRRKPTTPCYLCGREFGSASIKIHEPQCLVRWRAENDKLPADRKRAEPRKPDVVLTAGGQVDFQGTMDAIWQSHLGQLVPCKHCSRTFNPDRVDVHERSCKGPKS